eukprot:CAMPEP_0182863768 /NCGR_PEP_ID=MMETSP0034_2-20130328/6825_1 /TAXON_ID=156128 /ORGANISM="Nephroselmis pyriformis, Strain CCMP717" /LENGTH=217 /DNA_ID=CAMNT_0024996007 /DNA_START=14 /DNA_END=668 /DNA_ORIENTATION=-
MSASCVRVVHTPAVAIARPSCAPGGRQAKGGPWGASLRKMSTSGSPIKGLAAVKRRGDLTSAAVGKESGGGVLDKPSVTSPGRESEFDLSFGTQTKPKQPPWYNVLLHNDNVNRREYVVKVLMKVIPGMTVDNALNIMNQAHVNGMATVITCAQEEAEEYCEKMRGAGLISTVEPSKGKGGGDDDGPPAGAERAEEGDMPDVTPGATLLDIMIGGYG